MVSFYKDTCGKSIILVPCTILAECPMENQFPCKDTEGSIVCLSELQFCDGTLDCGDGSDEPSDCLSGTACHLLCL